VGVKHRTAVVTATLILLAVVVPLAAANGPMGGTERLTVAMPPNGESIATRAPMPASSTVGTISVQEQSADENFFDSLTAYLTNKPTFGARAVSCVLMYAQLKTYSSKYMSYKITEPTLQDLFLDVCIQLALSISQQQGGAPRMLGKQSATGCRMTNLAVPVTITRSGSKYVASASGMSYTPKSSAARISCTHTASGMTITERPRSRTAKLATVAGPILGVGFSSASSSPGKLKIALGVR
jgi:hypothetical protein